MAKDRKKSKRKYKQSDGEHSEYTYQSKPAQKKNRALRNKVNREAKEDGRIAKGDGTATPKITNALIYVLLVGVTTPLGTLDNAHSTLQLVSGCIFSVLQM